MPYKHGVTGSIPVVPTSIVCIQPDVMPSEMGSRRKGSAYQVLIRGPVVQLVRTPACHAGGRRFESVLGRQRAPKGAHTNASVAQSVEQWTENPRVVGSIPTGGTIFLHPGSTQILPKWVCVEG